VLCDLREGTDYEIVFFGEPGDPSLNLTAEGPWLLQGQVLDGRSFTTAPTYPHISQNLAGPWKATLSPMWACVETVRCAEVLPHAEKVLFKAYLSGCQLIRGVVPDDLHWSHEHIGRLYDLGSDVAHRLFQADNKPSKYAWSYAGLNFEIRRQQKSVPSTSSGLNATTSHAWIPIIVAKGELSEQGAQACRSAAKVVLDEVERACLLLGFFSGYAVDWHEYEAHVDASENPDVDGERYRLMWTKLNLAPNASARGTRSGHGRRVGVPLTGRFDGMLDEMRRNELVWTSAITSYLHALDAPLHSSFLLLSTALESVKSMHLAASGEELLVGADDFKEVRAKIQKALGNVLKSKEPPVPSETRRQMYSALGGLNRPTYSAVIQVLAKRLSIDLTDHLDEKGGLCMVPIRDSVVHTGRFPSGCEPLHETRRLKALVEMFMLKSLGLTAHSGQHGMGCLR